MTQAVANILNQVERLSTEERLELHCCIIEQLPATNDLTDNDFAALAAASFKALDDEEQVYA